MPGAWTRPILWSRKLSPVLSTGWPAARSLQCAKLPLPIPTVTSPIQIQTRIQPKPAHDNTQKPPPSRPECRLPLSKWPPLRPSSASPPAAASPRPSSTPARSSGPRPSPAPPSSRPSPPTSAPLPSCAPSTPRRPLRSSPPGTIPQGLAAVVAVVPRRTFDCVGRFQDMWGGLFSLPLNRGLLPPGTTNASSHPTTHARGGHAPGSIDVARS